MLPLTRKNNLTSQISCCDPSKRNALTLPRTRFSTISLSFSVHRHSVARSSSLMRSDRHRDSRDGWRRRGEDGRTVMWGLLQQQQRQQQQRQQSRQRCQPTIPLHCPASSLHPPLTLSVRLSPLATSRSPLVSLPPSIHT